MIRVAALYIDLAGPYPGIDGVDCWDAARDARLYAGPWRVVAHVPCADWGGMRAQAKDPGGRKELGPIAVAQVREYGGILEHPAGSLLWRHCGLPRPGEFPDKWGGYTIEVDQCRWGHKARKRTWLYCVGVDPARIVIPPWREPTHVIGRPRGSGEAYRGRHVPKSQRHITPPAFARWLVDLVTPSSFAVSLEPNFVALAPTYRA